jgi:site-specific DNA-methyltransferase (adenine-specific)
MLCLDPPYGSGNTHLRAQNIVEETKIENDEEGVWRELMPRFFEQAARVLDQASSAILCFGEGGGPKRISNRISDWMACYLEFDTTLVWNKTIPGMGWTYRRSHEFIFVGHKKKSKLRWIDKGGAATTVINLPRIVNPEEGSHPTPKPVNLMSYLISNHTKRGDIVCDPFSGGCSTGDACIKLGRRFIGFEISPHWVAYGNDRLSRQSEQLDLFGG